MIIMSTQQAESYARDVTQYSPTSSH